MQFKVVDLGFCEYKEALTQQEKYHKLIADGKDQDVLIFVEHEPVYTLGKNADDSNILGSYPNDVKIYYIDRGGDVTYHGPGQIVGYPIFNIKNQNMSIGKYVHTMENVLIETLANFGIEAQVRNKLIGVWIAEQKIASIGVRVIDGVTKHGFALNVNTDLSYFNGIIPCGIENCKVTSMEQLLNIRIDLKVVQKVLIEKFENNFS